MSNISKISVLVTAIVFVLGAFVFVTQMSNTLGIVALAPPQALALGTSGGSGSSGGSGGDSGCCNGGSGYSQSSYNTYSQSSYNTYSQSSYSQPSAKCQDFSLSPTTVPYDGADVTLTWNTKNATNVSINQGIGDVDDDGSTTVFVDSAKTFKLTATGTGGNDDCEASVEVETQQIASCDLFTISPNNLPDGGGNVTLTWKTTNATNVSINQSIGDVDDDGSKTVFVDSAKTFKLTATGVDGDDDCQDSVTIDEPDSFSCDYFDINKNKVEKGEDFTLSWGTTNADSVSINQGIGDVDDDGTYTTSTNNDKTYTLTVTKGDESKTCKAPIEVERDNYSQGSYGGGSSRPRCDLDASATKINAGKEVKLEWDTSNATEVILKDSKGNVLMTTEDLLARDKRDFYDGEIIVRPTKDTTYTLFAERGSKDDECEVDIRVTDDVTVYEVRDQKPLATGIYLTQVPYTGFEAGPTLTFIFYTLLTLWALFVAYILIIKKDSIAGFSLAGAYGKAPYKEVSVEAHTGEHLSEAEEYVQSTITADAPINLPTGQSPVGYAAFTQEDEQEVDALTELENHAHEQRVLLSSDAMRHFANTVANEEEQLAKLDEVIASAKASFPSEDGWLVLNLSRMESLMTSNESEEEAVLDTTPTTAGSLAEAIVTGNVVAAYEMIASRPMIALADAASDLDAVYRARKGEEVQVSNMLTTSSAALTAEQLEAAIAALTGALDGTYTDEASAVKMAIMKAVKAVA